VEEENFEKGNSRLQISETVIQSVTWNLDVQYPYPFSSLLSILSIFSFDFISSACMFPESANLLSEVYMWSAMPAALSTSLLLSYLARMSLPGANFDELRSQHTYYVLLMSYLTLPSVSLKQFQVRLSTIKVEDL
jgi:hypothetical protein